MRKPDLSHAQPDGSGSWHSHYYFHNRRLFHVDDHQYCLLPKPSIHAIGPVCRGVVTRYRWTGRLFYLYHLNLPPSTLQSATWLPCSEQTSTLNYSHFRWEGAPMVIGYGLVALRLASNFGVSSAGTRNCFLTSRSYADLGVGNVFHVWTFLHIIYRTSWCIEIWDFKPASDS